MEKLSNTQPVLLRAFQSYLTDMDTASFLMIVAQRYSVGTLEKLTRADATIVRRAATFAVGLMGTRDSLETLGPLLSDPDRSIRLVADDAIKSIWERSYAPFCQARVAEMLRLLEQSAFAAAIVASSDLISIDNQIPDWFCQRGLAKLHLEDFEGACLDCDRAIKICRFHYPAWIGLGYGRLEQGQPLVALSHFRRALQIYPDLDYVRQQVHNLERALWELQ